MKQPTNTFQRAVLGTVLAASLIAAGGGVIKHETQLSGIETELRYIREALERIEYKLDKRK